jgi:hypothetical protein
MRYIVLNQPLICDLLRMTELSNSWSPRMTRLENGRDEGTKVEGLRHVGEGLRRVGEGLRHVGEGFSIMGRGFESWEGALNPGEGL